jgi:thiosulfate dehydrogenase
MKRKILAGLLAVATLAIAGEIGSLVMKGRFIGFIAAEGMSANGQATGIKPAVEVQGQRCPVFTQLSTQLQAGSGNIIRAGKISASAGKITPRKAEQKSPSAVYNPPSPQDAPDDIKNAVMLGYNIIVDTQTYASRYTGSKLNCTNCHFEGGITQGGKNGGISLVGVAAKYPAYRTRENAVISLATKVNACFERSMNGKSLPPEGEEMTAILTYLQWIARDLPVYAEIPWLGLKKLESDHTPDREKGTQLFPQICSACHGLEGQGGPAPPLWGSDSFNDGASLGQLQNMAAFIHANMPKGNPTLSVEDALDTADYVTSQPRPHYEAK